MNRLIEIKNKCTKLYKLGAKKVIRMAKKNN